MTAAAVSLFWVSTAGVALTYFLYPGLVWLLARFRSPEPDGRAPEQPLPRISLVVVAHNEEQVIARRLENLARLDYPVDRLEILVLSDGSTDATVSRAEAAAPANAQVLDYRERTGKSAVLTRAAAHMTGDIVAFTDANCLWQPDALSALVAPFRDPTIGCVVGQLTYVNTDNPRVARGESLYWRYENEVKRLESRLGSTVVANGSIYALRRPLLRPAPAHVDYDSMMPLQVLQSGFRVVFETAARATEKAAETLAEEYRRKVRIINQQIWGLVAARGLLAWRTRWAAVALFCHKVVRWGVPFLLGLNLLAAVALLPGRLALLAVAAHGALATAAFLGWVLDRLGLPAGWLWVATYFWGVNLASVAGVLSCFGGRRIHAWEKAASTR